MLARGLDRVTPAVSLTEQVYAQIKRAILNLDVKPGEPLVEAELAGKLGTSKTPVREALRRLETEGLVVSTPYKGALAAPLIPRDMQEIFEARGSLEGMIARMAAGILTDEQIRSLGELLELSEQSLAEGKLTESRLLGAEFHQRLVNLVGHRRIGVLLSNLSDQIERFQRMVERIPGRVARSMQEHRRIYEAVAARDADLAQLTVIRHFESFLEDFMTEHRDEFSA